MSLPPVFIINLPESIARRARITAQLSVIGVTPIILPAKRGTQADLETSGYRGWMRRLFYGRDLLVGEYGCARSQLAVYQYIVENNIPQALVLEDDALVDAAKLSAILAALEGCVKKAGMFYDFVRFLDEEKVRQQARPIATLLPDVTLYRALKQTGGAYGYLVTQRAARQLLKDGQRLWRPIDTMHAQAWLSGLQVFVVNPSPVKPDHEIESTIGAVRFNKKNQLGGFLRLVYPVTRTLYKLVDGFMGRTWLWRHVGRDKNLRRLLGGDI